MGAKIIDNISKEVKDEFPDLKGFSPRKLKYMRKFAEEYKEIEFVQEALAQITWYHNITLIEKVKDKDKSSKQKLFTSFPTFVITSGGTSR